MSGPAIFADDTPVSVRAPGNGKTKTARLGAYVRDERPWAGEDAPAAFYRFTPDRKASWPAQHLSRFKGFMHADGYAGFEGVCRAGRITEVACMAHIRRKFFDVHASQGSAIAGEALERIAQLYAIDGGRSGPVAPRQRGGCMNAAAKNRRPPTCAVVHANMGKLLKRVFPTATM